MRLRLLFGLTSLVDVVLHGVVQVKLQRWLSLGGGLLLVLFYLLFFYFFAMAQWPGEESSNYPAQGSIPGKGYGSGCSYPQSNTL